MTVTVDPNGSLKITAGEVVWAVSPTGSVSAVLGQTELVAAGPALMVLAIHKNDFAQLNEQNDRSYGIATDSLSGWISSAKPTYTMVNPATPEAAALVTVKGSYTAQAVGEFRLLFRPEGALRCGFDFTWTGGGAVSPRQIGVVFDLPRGVDHLSWQRRGQFSYYSPSDVGRNTGFDVRPLPCDSFFGSPGGACGQSAGTLWADDTTPAGSNDFRSTRDALQSYVLCAEPGRKQCVGLLGNGTANGEPGTLSGRAWLNGSAVRMLGATLSNEGGNSFTQPIAVLPHVAVGPKAVVAGEVRLFVHRAPQLSGYYY